MTVFSLRSGVARALARACEIRRKWAGAALVILVIAAAPAAAQPPEPAHEPPARPADAAGMADAQPGEHGDEHAESPWALAGRVLNFVLLAGTIGYFLRRPLARYLSDRRAQVRADLEAAERMKASAAAQMADMEARLKALPGELAALEAKGRQEIAAEEERIRAAAERERDRLLEQARREIDQRVRLAERELIEHAAALAIGVAEARIRREITPGDQAYLVDRYLDQVKADD